MASARRKPGTFHRFADRQVHHHRGRNRKVEVARHACLGLRKALRLSRVSLFTLTLLWAFLPASLGAGNGSGPVALRIIVVTSQTEAEQILVNVQKGADFAALAREKSIDPSAADGGSLGRVDLESLRTELRDALMG